MACSSTGFTMLGLGTDMQRKMLSMAFSLGYFAV